MTRAGSITLPALSRVAGGYAQLDEVLVAPDRVRLTPADNADGERSGGHRCRLDAPLVLEVYSTAGWVVPVPSCREVASQS